MQPLRVTLGERSYPIHLGAGLLRDPSLYAPHAAGRSVAIVSNPVVTDHYLERVSGALASAGARSVLPVTIEDGEQAKSWQTLDRVLGALLGARFGRDSLVVALGGGVVGDLAGFAAAIYQRGVPYLQAPTTLLAQVDSSVGGKTAINHARGKNMVGAFHQPIAVIADVTTLGTLPPRELRAGIAEVIKHALILDRALLEWLETNLAALLRGQAAALEHVVRRSCELQSQGVAADEREGGLRAILNFGHTFGHAIELGAGYGTWLHGEAVAAGMVMAAELSSRACGLPRTDVDRVRSLIERAGLPSSGPSLGAERYLELMQGDKKASGGRLRFVLLESLGRAAVRGDIDPQLVRESIAAAVR